MDQLVRSKTEVACIVADLQAAEGQEDGQRGALEGALKQVVARVQEKEVELMEVEPAWAKAQKDEAGERHKYDSHNRQSGFLNIIHRLDVVNARLQTLYSKQGRLAQFSSAQERDTFLRTEIKSIQGFEKTQKQALEDLRREEKDLKGQMSSLDSKEFELQASLENRGEQLRQLDDEISKAKDEKAKMTERRK